jgi:hypothetical protein
VTDKYLTYIAIQKWDGKMPYFFGDVLPFVQIPTNSTTP